MTYKMFSVGDVLTALDVQTIQDQSVIRVASAAERDAIPGPVQGMTVYRADKGWTERYFAAYNAATNPAGTTPAGWYPVGGGTPTFEAWNNATQAVAAADTVINLQTSGLLTGGFELTGNAAKLPVNGRYRLTAYYYIWTTAGTYRNVSAWRGAKRIGVHTQSTPWTVGYLTREFDGLAGDLITLKAGGDGAVTIQPSTKAADESPMLAITYVGPLLGAGA